MERFIGIFGPRRRRPRGRFGLASTRSAVRARLPTLAFLAVLGPGLVSGFADNDAGGITTYSVVGAQFGYALLWVVLASMVALFVTREVGARLGLATGRGLLDLVREGLRIRWAGGRRRAGPSAGVDPRGLSFGRDDQRRSVRRARTAGGSGDRRGAQVRGAETARRSDRGRLVRNADRPRERLLDLDDRCGVRAQRDRRRPRLRDTALRRDRPVGSGTSAGQGARSRDRARDRRQRDDEQGDPRAGDPRRLRRQGVGLPGRDREPSLRARASAPARPEDRRQLLRCPLEQGTQEHLREDLAGASPHVESRIRHRGRPGRSPPATRHSPETRCGECDRRRRRVRAKACLRVDEREPLARARTAYCVLRSPACSPSASSAPPVRVFAGRVSTTSSDPGG